MNINKWLPRTLAGQLMALLFGVLIIAQIINLVLLVGTQRLQAQSNAYTTAVNYSARLISELPPKPPAQLPYFITTERGEPIGEFFLSNENIADSIRSSGPDAEKKRVNLPRYNLRFQALLNKLDISPIHTSMTTLLIDPSSGPRIASGPRSGPPRRGAEIVPPGARRPGPPPNSNGPPRPRPFPMDSIEGDLFTIQEIRLSAEIEPGLWFNAIMPHAKTESLTGRILLATALLLGLSLLAVWVFARRLSRPISEFARAAEQLGRGEEPDRLSETGPVDMQQAASAFNIMQTRITRMLETQRMMLRAVGHDLRTPLTTLRLRAENIEENLEREKVIRTIQDMTVITEEILSWSKDASGTEDIASVDLRSFLESLTDDYKDQGRDVSLQDFETRVIKIRRISIKRALQNLINNALKFGNVANLSVERNDTSVLIHVDDTGPGVPAPKLQEILKPFVRLEASRSKETGGTGLGLSIANSIVQIHGGTLTLSNRKSGGLRATLTIPL